MSKLIYSKDLGPYTFEVWNDLPNKADLFTVNQIHSDITINADKELINLDGDAIISRTHKTMAIKTADCVPIAIIGKEGASLIHAGWKGLQLEIVKNDLIKSICPERAIIGPHIRVKNYEVGEDFKKNFPNSPYFEEIEGRICFNMLDTVIQQLSSTYPGIIIEDSKLDTYNEDTLRSYRRGDKELRNWNILKYN